MNGNTNKLLGMPARSVLPFSIGIVLAWYHPYTIQTEAYITAICSTTLLALLLNKFHFTSSFLIYLAAAELGAMLMNISSRDMRFTYGNEYEKYDAVIISNPQKSGKTWKMDAIVTEIKGKAEAPFKTRMTILYPEDSIPLSIGNGIECISVMKEPTSRNGSNFDYGNYMKTQGFKTETFVYPDNVIRKAIKQVRIPLRYRLAITLQRYRTKLISIYSSKNISENNLAVISALTMGDKSFLTKQLKEQYSIAGASHILALSGLHLGIIYYILTLLLWRKNRLRWWRITVRVILMITIWGYVALVGMPISAIRSAIMLTIYSIVEISNRNTSPINTILTAAAIILAVNPISIFDIGFQMSFLAVMFIIMLSKPLHSVLALPFIKRNYLLNTACKVSATSIAAQIGVMPLTAYYFGRISCWFLLSNLIVIPLATLLLYVCLTTLATTFIPALQSAFICATENIVQMMNSIVLYIAKLPGASIEGISINTTQVSSLYIAMAASLLIVKTIVIQHKVTPFNMPYSIEE